MRESVSGHIAALEASLQREPAQDMQINSIRLHFLLELLKVDQRLLECTWVLELCYILLQC